MNFALKLFSVSTIIGDSFLSFKIQKCTCEKYTKKTKNGKFKDKGREWRRRWKEFKILNRIFISIVSTLSSAENYGTRRSENPFKQILLHSWLLSIGL